jgi:tetratricopeptide (TPR) repeat protein
MPKVAPKRKGKSLFDEQPQKKDDLAALIESIKKNPALYAAGAAFIILCFLAGILYRGYAHASQKDLATQYARALEQYEPAKLVEALEPLAFQRGPLGAEVTYAFAEAVVHAQQWDKAKAAFERFRSEYPDSPSLPDAVEGLGFIAEQKGDTDAALAYYREVASKWASSFAARCQPSNVARIEEQRGDFKAALEAYREQVTTFPGSHLAEDAQASIDRLTVAHPELAPAPVPAASPAPEMTPSSEGSIETPKLNITLPSQLAPSGAQQPEAQSARPDSAPQPTPAPPAKDGSS